MALTLTAAAMLTAAGVGVLWLLIGQGPSGNDEQPTQTVPLTTTERTTTAPALTTSLPGTDGSGFVNYPGARCDAGNEPAVLARTDKSVLVVCRAGPGSYYYRGVRLNDNAGIELANAVRSSGGFDVTNPTDGTRYEIRRSGLTIVQPDGQRSFEPMLEYASN